MIGVSPDVHYAAARFALLTGGRFVRSKTDGYGGIQQGDLLEYLAGGEVLARKIVALQKTLCWLRADIAQAAQAALDAEAAESQRVALEVARWSRQTDERAAEAAGMSLEAFRTQRNHAGMRFDRYRAGNRTGAR